MSYNTTFSDGTSDVNSGTFGGALRVIANRYSVAVDTLSVETSDDRTLVWMSGGDAENDDGSNAVAEIKKIK